MIHVIRFFNWDAKVSTARQQSHSNAVTHKLDFFFFEIQTHLNANKETSQDADGCVGGCWRTGSL